MHRVVVLRVVALVLVLSGCTALSQAQGGSCKDPWINQAYNQLYHRAPSGSANTGECNIALYGGGHWSSYADLTAKIQAAKAPTRAPAPAPVAAVSSAFHLDRSLNILNASGAIVARAGTYSLVRSNGVAVNPSSLVASGGGNLVASGGGN